MSDFNLEIDPIKIKDAVRRSFMLAMSLEFRQGYTKEEFSLPAEVSENPNPNINLPNITNPEFMAELSDKVWAVFDKELEGTLNNNIHKELSLVDSILVRIGI